MLSTSVFKRMQICRKKKNIMSQIKGELKTN